MRSCLASAMVVCLLASGTGAGSAWAGYPANEVWLGSGVARSFEKSIFNIPGDIKPRFDPPISLGWAHNLDAHRALCLHGYGGIDPRTVIAVQGSGGSQLVPFELSMFDFGVRYRHTFRRGRFTPYAFAGVSVVTGLLERPGIPDLSYYGVSGCLGPGATFGLGGHFTISAEGLGSIGTASWQKPPFSNSLGRRVNPAMVTAMIHVNYGWGWKD